MRKYGVDGKLEILPNQYKTIGYPKTVYDPSVITDEEMLRWGKTYWNQGRLMEGKVHGYASNGVEFEGYINLETGEITNFYPIIKWQVRSQN